MTTPPLTPAMARLLTRIHRAGRPSFEALGVPAARRAYTAGAEILDLPRAALPRVEALAIAAGDGTSLAARLCAPSAGVLPATLFLQGGGFTVGNLETHDSLCRQLALPSGAAVVALDYRLAPEHRFPTAVDDAWAALRWLAANAGSLGLDPTRLAVGGDSAGATLAAVAAIHARDIGLPLRLQGLITPGTGAHADTALHRTFGLGVWAAEVMARVGPARGLQACAQSDARVGHPCELCNAASAPLQAQPGGRGRGWQEQRPHPLLPAPCVDPLHRGADA